MDAIVSDVIEQLQANAPLVILAIGGFWLVMSKLHDIDKRLVRVETKLDTDDV